MNGHEFLSLVRDHARCHHGLFTLVTRVLLYTSGMIVAMHASRSMFDGSQEACVAAFMAMSATVELLWNRAHCGGRLWWYVACVAGIAICSLNLMHEATHFQKCCQARERLQAAPSVEKNR